MSPSTHLPRRLRRALALTLLCLAACTPLASPSQPPTQTGTALPYTVFASGLNQPRGLVVDAQGNLYVAEAGARAADSPDDPPTRDANAPLPELNHSGRLLRFTPAGQMTILLDGLPYTYYPQSGDVGVTDVALYAGTVYALTGEGYDDALARRVLRLPPAHTPPPRAASDLVIANLHRFAESVTPMDEILRSGGAASNPYAMVVAPYHLTSAGQTQTGPADKDEQATDMAFYITDGATGRILRSTLDGEIRVFAELPNLVPIAGLALGPDHRLYFTMFSERPHLEGSGALWAVGADGTPAQVVPDLTMPIDVDFAPQSEAETLFVLEFGSNLPAQTLYAPQRGRLLRIDINVEDAVSQTVVLERLHYPTAMAFAPGGDLYLAVGGAFSTAGQGAILQVPCHTLATCPNPSN